MQGGAIPGVMLATHSNGVTVYVGMGPIGEGFAKKFYPCAPIDNTLFSGLVSKVYGYSHIFLCSDGVYVVGQDGALINLTVEQIRDISALNSSYSSATVQAGKYLAFGNALGLEYDFRTKTLLKRSGFAIAGACVWNNVNYFAVGNRIVASGAGIDTTADFGCSLTLPYSDLSQRGKKSFECLYFSGTIAESATFTAADQEGESWSVVVEGPLVDVSRYRIMTPRGHLGNRISIKIACSSDAFRIEELAAVVYGSQRSRQ
jgi:hypothetical protein